jgi:hypothetical protein
MDEDLVADRLTQLRTRRDELTRTLDDEPTTSEPATTKPKHSSKPSSPR